MKVTRVGIAEMKIVESPAILKTSGLGSCVAVIFWEKQKKIGGMIHIMLPTHPEGKIDLLTKYANTGIPELLRELEQKGVKKQNIVAKIVGGADMFPFLSKNKVSSIQIGTRNIEKTKETLASLGIPIEFEDVAGTKGRTIEFDVETGILSVQTITPN